MATVTKTARIIIASTSNAANATTRGAIDLRTSFGGQLTCRITNGATGPTAQCLCNILQAHEDGTTPALGSAGATWKRIAVFGGGTASNADNFLPVVQVGPGVQHLEIEFTGNTGQAVTVEALFTEITSIS
jgi:hypothetical protein